MPVVGPTPNSLFPNTSVSAVSLSFIYVIVIKYVVPVCTPAISQPTALLYTYINHLRRACSINLVK